MFEGVLERQQPAIVQTGDSGTARAQTAPDETGNAALAAGGRSLSEPRDRPEFGTGYYSAYVIDPEGNGIEAAYQPDSTRKG